MRRRTAITLSILALMLGYLVGTPAHAPFSDPASWGGPPSLSNLLESPVEAQAGDFRGFQKTFVSQSAPGATATSGLMRGIPVWHTAELIVTGGPAACTYRLQGSRDGVTWFNISAADITCTATIVSFEVGKPAVTVRGNLLTLSGGTTPTVTLKYIGR